MAEILVGVAGGIVSGVVAAALGYAKNHGEDFNAGRFFSTLAEGAFIGGTAAYLGVNYMTAESYLATIGGLTVFDYIKKAVWRRIGGKITGLFKAIDEKLRKEGYMAEE